MDVAEAIADVVQAGGQVTISDAERVAASAP
jgi:hypothetical protein